MPGLRAVRTEAPLPRSKDTRRTEHPHPVRLNIGLSPGVILIRQSFSNGRIPPLPKGYSPALTAVIKSMLNLNVSSTDSSVLEAELTRP